MKHINLTYAAFSTFCAILILFMYQYV